MFVTKLAHKLDVDRIHLLARDQAAADARLVAHDEDHETGALQARSGQWRLGESLDFLGSPKVGHVDHQRVVAV